MTIQNYLKITYAGLGISETREFDALLDRLFYNGVSKKEEKRITELDAKRV